MTKHRWAWAEIDLFAIAHNVRELKARTEPGTHFMAVVKADGYGHGALQVARAALGAGADRLGVATIDEAIELRSAGVKAPMQLLGEPPITAISELLAHDIIPTVTTGEFARALSSKAIASGKKVKLHLKVDTGMNRIGVRPEDVAEYASWLTMAEGLELEGTFTHLACADIPGDWEVRRQLERFDDALSTMRTEGLDPGIVHAAASAGTILWPEAHYDMVRCGISIYGLHPGPSTYGHIDLKPARSVRARLTLVKRIGIGEGVSYGLTWTAPAPSTVATLPLGYADGIHRVLSNQMEVLVGGVRCRQIGRVCMDQLMVELPRGMTAEVGDEAVLVGKQGSEEILLDELAEKAGTINYELSCGLGARLERVYKR
ncbi:MAG: alanine racemase [Coriobacteriia bacterium]